eukprot:TRINITY_DN1731_c0_g1_i1.p2 TRINITY_DN1731_c0_g1~~TRINITY_DN1731_c0_g1_i1.p2  ORF type:complete len:178 (+),score=74.74 TRINITY_DN1731_c0_g1_i1:69-602(+)
MLREVMFANYMAEMSQHVGITCDMGKEGRSEMEIGNGWVEHTRPDGKRFYVNEEKNKRTWTRPTQGVVPEEDTDKCRPFVSRMQYEGKYPKAIETVTNDGYDCETFLEKLYSLNETKWAKTVGTEAPAPARPMPYVGDGTGQTITAAELAPKSAAEGGVAGMFAGILGGGEASSSSS